MINQVIVMIQKTVTIKNTYEFKDKNNTHRGEEN